MTITQLPFVHSIKQVFCRQKYKTTKRASKLIKLYAATRHFWPSYYCERSWLSPDFLMATISPIRIEDIVVTTTVDKHTRVMLEIILNLANHYFFRFLLLLDLGIIIMSYCGLNFRLKSKTHKNCVEYCNTNIDFNYCNTWWFDTSTVRNRNYIIQTILLLTYHFRWNLCSSISIIFNKYFGEIHTLLLNLIQENAANEEKEEKSGLSQWTYRHYNSIRKCVAEFIGTCMFVYVGEMSQKN